MQGRAAEQRVEAVLEAARRVRESFLSSETNLRRLAYSTGLSVPGVVLALEDHLEVDATPDQVKQLTATVGQADRVVLVLSANVFVASLRALALAVASSETVLVKASSREHLFVDALLDALEKPGSGVRMGRSSTLDIREGDVVHLYGRDETVAAVAREMPTGARIWPHAAGMGVAFLSSDDATGACAESLAKDVVVFDQNGCLSPRVVLFEGERETARRFAQEFAAVLVRMAEVVPVGRVAENEAAAATRYKATLRVTGELFEHPGAVVGCSERFVLPPAGRHVHVCWEPQRERLISALRGWERWVAAIGFGGKVSVASRQALTQLVPWARTSPVGRMQRPPLDGPVDLRIPWPMTRDEALQRYAVASSG